MNFVKKIAKKISKKFYNNKIHYYQKTKKTNKKYIKNQAKFNKKRTFSKKWIDNQNNKRIY